MRVLLWDYRLEGHHQRWITALADRAPSKVEVFLPAHFHRDATGGLVQTGTGVLLRDIASVRPAVTVVMESHALIRGVALARRPVPAAVYLDLRGTHALFRAPDRYRGVSPRRRAEAGTSLLAREIVVRRSHAAFGYLNAWAPQVGSSKLRRSSFTMPDPIESLTPHDAPSPSTDRFVFLLAGALNERKGADLALDALSRVVQVRPELASELELRLCGKLSSELAAQLAPKLRTVQRESPGLVVVQDRFLSSEELAREFVDADVLLLPYVKEFGSSGMLASSVMLKPTRVIASDFGWLGHMVTASGGQTFNDSDPAHLARRMIEAFDATGSSGAGVVTSLPIGFGSEDDFAECIWSTVERVDRA